MRQSSFALALLASAALAACGGGDQAPKVKFSAQVSFGDSLSDVGTYSVGTIKALGGGKYTVNGTQARNWTELMAAQLGLSAPCAAQTGLDGLASEGFSVPVVNHAGCTAYAQGGARVTDPVGPGNKLLGGSNALLGQLTVPVVAQIRQHLALNGGTFRGDEAVFVLAGGNDALIQLGVLSDGATAAATAAVTAALPGQIQKDILAGSCQPVDVNASNCQPAAIATLTPSVGAAAAADYVQANAPAVVSAMGIAGFELAGYVKSMIVARGAKYVTVVNLPDLSVTPYALSQSAATRALITAMVTTFNSQLQTALAGNANVLVVDAYAVNRDQYANPGSYGLSNVTTPACDLSAAKNPLGSSLVCSAANTVAGDVSRYGYADSVHPTPYANLLLARYVSKEMASKGWL